MREGKFLAREKKTYKMTRDGLVEKSALSKEERRISRRTADFSLDKRNRGKKRKSQKTNLPKGKRRSSGISPVIFIKNRSARMKHSNRKLRQNLRRKQRRKRRFYRGKGRHPSIPIRRTKRQENQHLFAVPALILDDSLFRRRSSPLTEQRKQKAAEQQSIVLIAQEKQRSRKLTAHSSLIGESRQRRKEQRLIPRVRQIRVRNRELARQRKRQKKQPKSWMMQKKICQSVPGLPLNGNLTQNMEKPNEGSA